MCYERVNAIGNWNGNCGKDGARFKPCAEKLVRGRMSLSILCKLFSCCVTRDVLCGKLICMGGKSRPLLATDRYFFMISVSQFVCKTIQSTNGTSDSGDISSVSDGTKCGDGKVLLPNSRNDRTTKPLIATFIFRSASTALV